MFEQSGNDGFQDSILPALRTFVVHIANTTQPEVVLAHSTAIEDSGVLAFYIIRIMGKSAVAHCVRAFAPGAWIDMAEPTAAPVMH